MNRYKKIVTEENSFETITSKMVAIKTFCSGLNISNIISKRGCRVFLYDIITSILSWGYMYIECVVDK